MTLYLLPNLIGPVADHQLFFPPNVALAVAKLDGLIAESDGEGRRFLKRFTTKKPTYQVPLALFPKKITERSVNFLLEPVVKGETWGVISDSGLPCLADPGAALVLRARQLNLSVEAFSGPSSIFLALMLSGLSGQSFNFRGYIPKMEEPRREALQLWQAASQQENSTQLFIESPHRNEQTFATCLEVLEDETLLCVASYLTMPEQWVETKSVRSWKKISKEQIAEHMHKKPTVFLFQSRQTQRRAEPQRIQRTQRRERKR